MARLSVAQSCAHIQQPAHLCWRHLPAHRHTARAAAQPPPQHWEGNCMRPVKAREVPAVTPHISQIMPAFDARCTISPCTSCGHCGTKCHSAFAECSR